MTVHELIRALSNYDPYAKVFVCADNGTVIEPADLSYSTIRCVDDGAPTDKDITVAIWLPWQTWIENDVS